MPGRSVATITAASLIAGGCAFETAVSPALPSPVTDPAVATLLDDGCAPHDPRIAALAARLAALNGREGYYARREIAAAAADRDELVRRLLARDRALRSCMPAGKELSRRLWTSMTIIGPLVEGRDPISSNSEVVIYDLEVRPRAMPFVDRACSGHGFEGAAACFVLFMPAGIADIVTLPLGTWFWAARDKETAVALRSFPPAAALQREVAAELALRQGEWARDGLVEPVTPEAR